jgi:hypothetical protein
MQQAKCARFIPPLEAWRWLGVAQSGFRFGCHVRLARFGLRSWPKHLVPNLSGFQMAIGTSVLPLYGHVEVVQKNKVV